MLGDMDTEGSELGNVDGCNETEGTALGNPEGWIEKEGSALGFKDVDGVSASQVAAGVHLRGLPAPADGLQQSSQQSAGTIQLLPGLSPGPAHCASDGSIETEGSMLGKMDIDGVSLTSEGWIEMEGVMLGSLDGRIEIEGLLF